MWSVEYVTYITVRRLPVPHETLADLTLLVIQTLSRRLFCIAFNASFSRGPSILQFPGTRWKVATRSGPSFSLIFRTRTDPFRLTISSRSGPVSGAVFFD